MQQRGQDPRLFERPLDLSSMPCHFGRSSFTSKEEEDIANNLKRNLGPEYISTRAGPGGSKLTYLEGWKAIHLANEIFGFNGWSTSIVHTSVDYEENNSGRINLGISAIVRVTLRDGTFREDVGFGSIENAKTRANAYEKARKEAVTDSVKRALKSFGSALGGCFYDKDYLRKIQHCKVPQKPAFSMNELYRAPEFRQKKVEMKTMESEFGASAAHGPAVAIETTPELPPAPKDPVPLAGDIEVLDEEFLCDFSSQDERLLMAAASNLQDTHANGADVKKDAFVPSYLEAQKEPMKSVETSVINKSDGRTGQTTAPTRPTPLLTHSTPFYPSAIDSNTKKSTHFTDAFSKSITFQMTSSSNTGYASNALSFKSMHAPSTHISPRRSTPISPKKPTVPLRMISPQKHNAPPTIRPFVQPQPYTMGMSKDAPMMKKQKRSLYEDLDIPGFT